MFSMMYFGMFKAGKYHGKGELLMFAHFSDDKFLYADNFAEGEPEGQMTLSKTLKPTKPLRYERWEGGKCAEVIEL